MGLFQKAVETYDAHIDRVGKSIDNEQTLAPIGHWNTRAGLEITIERDGSFVSASLLQREAEKDDTKQNNGKIPIPVTEESVGRSSGVRAHPLCEQLGYLYENHIKKYNDYVQQLRAWMESPYSHPMLRPILTYVEGKTILSDLHKEGCITLTPDGLCADSKFDTLLVRWKVLGLEEVRDNVWQEPTLFDAFHAWYGSEHFQAWRRISAKDEKASATENCDAHPQQVLCMVTGKVDRPAAQHLKGIVPFRGSAKLISTNDSTGFTYRGRFEKPLEASSVSYTASQKAHNALAWLIANQSVRMGNRVFLCWNPQGVKICHSIGPIGNPEKKFVEPSDYQQALDRTLQGYFNQLPEETTSVIVATFDAATTGRLAVTYYNELMGSDYLRRLKHWDAHCCWYYEQKSGRTIRAPSLYDIINNAFGTIKNKSSMETNPNVLGQQVQRLLACRLNGAPFPLDIMRALLYRASTPQSYQPDMWENILSTACAVINYHHNKEDYLIMGLAPEKNDRSYQFGRLLAVMEKAEKEVTQKNATGKNAHEAYAIRVISLFHRRPMSTANDIQKHLDRAYLHRLKHESRSYYQWLMGEILEQISQFPSEEWDKPLTETYLIGYYLQRKALYSPKKNTEEDIQS